MAHQHQLSLVWAYILKFAPFILIPFFSSPWIFICAFGIHMLLMRAVIPTWMELLKQNLSKSEQGKICASVSTMNYLCLAFMPLAFGWALDFFQNSWRVVFIMTSLLGISSAYIIYRLVSNPCFSYKNKEQKKLKDLVINPWKTSFNLLSNRRDFFRFQVGFFFGGAGLMVIHAIIPLYFTETLNLSYTKMFIAVCFCKGMGFALASPIWVKLHERSDIFTFCSKVPFVAVSFPILMMLAIIHPYFVYIGYFLYGMMQAGSELGWKLSGPTFAKSENSTPYTSINVLAVGLRGGIFPYLGALLLTLGGPYLAFISGGLLCFLGGAYLYRSRREMGILPQKVA